MTPGKKGNENVQPEEPKEEAQEFPGGVEVAVPEDSELDAHTVIDFTAPKIIRIDPKFKQDPDREYAYLRKDTELEGKLHDQGYRKEDHPDLLHDVVLCSRPRRIAEQHRVQAERQIQQRVQSFSEPAGMMAAAQEVADRFNVSVDRIMPQGRGRIPGGVNVSGFGEQREGRGKRFYSIPG